MAWIGNFGGDPPARFASVLPWLCLLLAVALVVQFSPLGHWLGLPPRDARRLPQDNGGFSVVEFEGGVARVRSVNESAHLAGPETGK